MEENKKKDTRNIQVEVEFTEGYEQRFTEAVLRIYENRLRKKSDELQEEKQSDN